MKKLLLKLFLSLGIDPVIPPTINDCPDCWNGRIYVWRSLLPWDFEVYCCEECYGTGKIVHPVK